MSSVKRLARNLALLVALLAVKADDVPPNICSLGEGCQRPCTACNTRAFLYRAPDKAVVEFENITYSGEDETTLSLRLRVHANAWTSRCPVTAVALRMHYKARLAERQPSSDARMQLHSACSPQLGLKHSLFWHLPPGAMDQTDEYPLQAMFRGRLPVRRLLKYVSEVVISTHRHESIDLHFPSEPAFLYFITGPCFCFHGFFKIPGDLEEHSMPIPVTADDFQAF